MKNFTLFTLLLFFCSCQSKLDKVANKAYNLANEYIEALNNAKSKKEIRELERTFRNRSNLIDEEFEELDKNGDYSLEEMQAIMQNEKFRNIKERVKEAERNAYNRCE